MDHLRAMRLFVRVAELGSLTAASTDLGYARGAASASLTELEAYMGVQLVERTTRSLRLTDEGLRYLERARRILSEVEEMEAEIGSAERLPQGRLRVQVPPGVARIMLAPALPDFLRAHPGLSLELLSRNELPDFVAQGLDAAVFVGDLPDLGVVARPVGRMPMITVASPGYLAQRGTPASVADLDAHDCVGFQAPRSGQAVQWQFRVDGHPVSITPRSRLSFDAADAAKAAILADAGIMQLGSYMVYREIRSGRLVTVLDDLRPAGQQMYILHPRHRNKPRKLRVFEAFLLDLNREFRRRWTIRSDETGG